MRKLDEIRNAHFDASLLPGDEIDIQFPENQEWTQKLKDRFAQLKPLLVQELKDEQTSRRGLYRFIGYSTRKDMRGKGRLVMEFLSEDTGELILAYFNANITYQRGAKKGEYFKTGNNGRFWVSPNAKFGKLWDQALGQPDRWSTLYRQMSHLKPLYFSGQIEVKENYQELINIKWVY